jgi:hypothetical protein
MFKIRWLLMFLTQCVSDNVCNKTKLPSKYDMINTKVIKSRILRLARYVERMDGTRVVHQVLVRKPEAKRPLGRPRRRWEDNVRWD